jgi:hypothetical protein
MLVLSTSHGYTAESSALRLIILPELDMVTTLEGLRCLSRKAIWDISQALQKDIYEAGIAIEIQVSLAEATSSAVTSL